PMSTYLFTVAAGPWHGATTEYDGLELGVWCRASLAQHLEADELFHITRQCLGFQQRVFGRPFPFGTSYDQVFVPEFNAGAMENPGKVTFSDEQFLFRSRTTQGRRRLRAQVIAHEMAHMWFGDLVTMRWWDDLWLNESFAEFLGVHTVDRATDYDGAWADFAVSRKAWGYSADAMPTTHPVAPTDVPDNRAALLNFDGISYAKGASALRQLSAWLGEDVFFAGVRRYLDRHAWGNTTLSDLLQALEQESGRDLQAWADSWLRTSGTSTIRVADGAVLQDGDRPHHLGLGLYAGSPLRRRERLTVDLAGPRTPVSYAPADLVLPNDGDLTFAKVRLDATSLATARDRLASLDDPLARSLIWGSLWDSTRDAELPAADFVATVIRNVDAEGDPDVVGALLGQARTAALLYSREGDALVGQLHEHCRATVHETGSDLELVLLRATIGTADGPVAVPERLGDDEDIRWLQLRRLAVLGLVDAGRLEAEHRTRPTSTSENHLAYALAALPDPARKAAVWGELLGTAPLSNARGRALAAGFWQFGQEELLRPYVARYAAEVAGLFGCRSPQLATVLARLLYPATLLEPGVLAATRALEADDLPAGLRRVALEARADVSRALRARR
ncbi:MAG: aminopeptidase, partial [Frankiales bacterium]|nr:aminopeptidase [Frankiales bacterium]